MEFLRIKNRRIAWAFLIIVIVFIVLSIPFKDGRSTYAYWELIRDLGQIRQIDQGRLVELGPISSLGDFHFGPIYYYLAFPFVKILDFKLYSLALTSAFFMLLCVIGSFVLIKDWFKNEILAFLTFASMAISIMTFQLTKYGSNPNFIPFFIVLFFYSLRKLIDEPKNLMQTIILAVSFAVLTQLHAVTLLAIPIILVLTYITTNLKRVPIRSIIVFLFVNLVLYYPYLHYEFTHHFSNTQALMHLSNGANGSWEMYYSHLIQFVSFFINPILSTHSFFDALDIGGTWFTILVAVVFGLAPIVWIVNKRHRKYLFSEIIHADAITKKLLWFWFLVPAIIFILPLGRTSNFQYYYFFILYPIVFGPFAYGLIWLFRQGLNYTVIYCILAFLLLQALQIYLYINFVRGLV